MYRLLICLAVAASLVSCKPVKNAIFTFADISFYAQDLEQWSLLKQSNGTTSLLLRFYADHDRKFLDLTEHAAGEKLPISVCGHLLGEPIIQGPMYRAAIAIPLVPPFDETLACLDVKKRVDSP